MSPRADLAAFLRARRAAVTPESVGYAPGARRRTPGLRREEVALLAGVSVSWYTWLEQGRSINVSVDVLDALARTLQLDPVERRYLRDLAGHPEVPGPLDDPQQCPPGVLTLMAMVEPAPAYALGPTWDILAWNDPFARLFPEIRHLPGPERNLVWLMFGNAPARALNGEWESEARQTLSQFRAEVTPRGEDATVADLVNRLRSVSDEFREWWPRHDVARFETHRRVFNHAQAGRLAFESEQFVSAAAPGIRVIVHMPVPGDDSALRLSAVE